MSKTEKKFKQAIKLKPTDQEREIVINGLTKFYTQNPNLLKGKDLNEHIEDIINICIEGWTCASKDFIARVRFKTKWASPELRNVKGYTPNYGSEQDIVKLEEIRETEDKLTQTLSAKDIRKHLKDPDERKFWQEHEQMYLSDYEFNSSSDWSLLQQLLLEELTQRRISIAMLRDPDNNSLDDKMKASFERLVRAQQALGITRQQREAAGYETEGNIGQLVMLYEKKKKIIDKLEAQYKAEEKIMMAKHATNQHFDQIVAEKLMPAAIIDEMRKYKEDEDIEAMTLLAEAENAKEDDDEGY